MKFDEMCKAMLEEFAEFKIVPKANSRFMRTIGLLLRIVSFGSMGTFMSQFTTTIGTTIYTPTNWNSYQETQKVGVICHERIHMRQEQRMGFWYKPYYLLWFFPIGFAYGRMKLEREAYAESIRFRASAYGVESVMGSKYRERMIGHFTSAEYIWMWPFRKGHEEWFDDIVRGLPSRLSPIPPK